MPEQKKSDTIMKLELKGRPVTAECALGIDPNDDLMDGFNERLQTFFEIHEFDLGLKLTEGETGVGTGSQKGAEFARWRSITADELKNKPLDYPLEFEKFSFKRTLDRASPVLFSSCCASETFDSAAIVKRMSQGGDRAPVGFMRIDFTKILITGMDWSDGELVTESIDFICQSMDITLRFQTVDGSVTSTGQQMMNWPSATQQKRHNVFKK